MNFAMRTPAEETLLEHIGDRLADLDLDWDIRREPAVTDGPERRRPDAFVTIRHPQGEFRLLAEIEGGLRRQTIGAVIARLEQLARQHPEPIRTLLLADYVNPDLGDRLRAAGVLFVDAAGNAYLRGDGLYVWVTGRRDILRLERQRHRRRAFQPSGLKMVFTLLCKPEIVEEDYRTIAETANVALGTVQWVMRDLVEEGFVLRLGRFERRLIEPAALLDAWTPAYARELRPRLLLGRFGAPGPDWWREVDLHEHTACWGGEVAAAIYTRQLKPQQHTIYADKVPTRLIAEHGLKKNHEGRVEIRERFWHFTEDDPADTEMKQPVVPPILVYADLLALAEARTREVAHRLRKERIDGPFEAHVARWDR